MLLLHGANQHARYWDALVPYLDRYRLVALDARGHGLSGRAGTGHEQGYGAEQYVADLERVLPAIRRSPDEPIAVAGHSTGSLVAMIFAARHPESLRAAVFIDIDPRPPERQRARLQDAGRRPARRFASREEVASAIVRLTPGLAPTMVETLVDVGYERDEGGSYWPRLDPRTLAEFPQFDNTPLLPGIGLPALVIRGRDSTVSSEEAARDAVRALPRGESAVVPGGHQLHAQEPEGLAAVLEPFLQRHLWAE